MSSFDNGVAGYVHARAVVDVFFPVDDKGNADIRCRQCFFYRDSSHRCGLNYEICQNPDKYVGSSCPLLDDDDFRKMIKLYAAEGENE